MRLFLLAAILLCACHSTRTAIDASFLQSQQARWDPYLQGRAEDSTSFTAQVFVQSDSAFVAEEQNLDSLHVRALNHLWSDVDSSTRHLDSVGQPAIFYESLRQRFDGKVSILRTEHP